MRTAQIRTSCARLMKTSVLVALLAQSPSVWSDGFRLSPLKLFFDADSSSTSLKISNDGNQKVHLQLEAMAWNQDEFGEDRYTPTRDLIFFPKILSVDANSEHIVRVGYQGVPAHGVEKSYRLFVQELPLETPGKARMKFAVRMSIPVFVRAAGDAQTWNVGFVGLVGHGLDIRVSNTGNRFLMVGALQAIGRDQKGEEVFRSEDTGWYVLAGKARGFVLPVTIASCEKAVTLEVEVTVSKDTRSRLLNDFNCERLGDVDPRSNRVKPGS